jgi:hypothetical protein
MGSMYFETPCTRKRVYQLLWSVGLAIRLMELSGGVVRVRAVKQASLEF